MMLLTAKDIPFQVGKDNMAYCDAYLTGAKAQLKKVVEYIFGECPHGYGERLACSSCIKALQDEVKDES